MQPHPEWQSAQPPRLTTDDVQVWRIPLDCGEDVLSRLHASLADEERKRAARFHFEKDRRHFIAGRGAMRSLLAPYLQQRPEQVRFAYTIHGKPLLVGEAGAIDLRFNLTHSHGLALLAVTRGREIGVDVERIRDNLEGEKLAERFFSPREVAALRSLPPELRREAFFHCWTRKEAYIKAVGKGLTLPLDQFDVTLHPGEPAALMATRHDPQDVGRWSMRSLTPAEGYVGALLVEGHSWRLWCGHWTADESPSF
ncbi:MAG TPA: 4'-phosphopantetheinyl transferase superfamily protein [Gemmataceae bacterium]|nr:4'-phosphopantetheinyl transferase superfamily protein [Gemmataceae bacterium]